MTATTAAPAAGFYQEYFGERAQTLKAVWPSEQDAHAESS